MVPPLLILTAELLSAAAVALAARFSRRPVLPLAVAAADTFVAGLRLPANLWSLNEDFLPAVSVADTVSLIIGGIPPALDAAAVKLLGRSSLVVATGSVPAFVVNVVVL